MKATRELREANWSMQKNLELKAFEGIEMEVRKTLEMQVFVT